MASLQTALCGGRNLVSPTLIPSERGTARLRVPTAMACRRSAHNCQTGSANNKQAHQAGPSPLTGLLPFGPRDGGFGAGPLTRARLGLERTLSLQTRRAVRLSAALQRRDPTRNTRRGGPCWLSGTAQIGWSDWARQLAPGVPSYSPFSPCRWAEDQSVSPLALPGSHSRETRKRLACERPGHVCDAVL